ncbi:unnamed protein product [Protopolystoma xenopodis]|uniref:Uncharacterized protein n=1 Tax=Protopolystoma xenopodis TaxID=117903 RepID=A0A3S5BEU0_9PLAT|nr:unnamed protein product [Protopolystoma xenopodis]
MLEADLDKEEFEIPYPAGEDSHITFPVENEFFRELERHTGLPLRADALHPAPTNPGFSLASNQGLNGVPDMATMRATAPVHLQDNRSGKKSTSQKQLSSPADASASTGRISDNLLVTERRVNGSEGLLSPGENAQQSNRLAE